MKRAPEFLENVLNLDRILNQIYSVLREITNEHNPNVTVQILSTRRLKVACTFFRRIDDD